MCCMKCTCTPKAITCFITSNKEKWWRTKMMNCQCSCKYMYKAKYTLSTRFYFEFYYTTYSIFNTLWYPHPLFVIYTHTHYHLWCILTEMSATTEPFTPCIQFVIAVRLEVLLVLRAIIIDDLTIYNVWSGTQSFAFFTWIHWLMNTTYTCS